MKHARSPSRFSTRKQALRPPSSAQRRSSPPAAALLPPLQRLRQQPPQRCGAGRQSIKGTQVPDVPGWSRPLQPQGGTVKAANEWGSGSRRRAQHGNARARGMGCQAGDHGRNQAGRGHCPHVYHGCGGHAGVMMDVTDLADELGQKMGGWYEGTSRSASGTAMESTPAAIYANTGTIERISSRRSARQVSETWKSCIKSARSSRPRATPSVSPRPCRDGWRNALLLAAVELWRQGVGGRCKDHRARFARDAQMLEFSRRFTRTLWMRFLLLERSWQQPGL